jgi:hypothetical protein
MLCGHFLIQMQIMSMLNERVCGLSALKLRRHNCIYSEEHGCARAELFSWNNNSSNNFNALAASGLMAAIETTVRAVHIREILPARGFNKNTNGRALGPLLRLDSFCVGVGIGWCRQCTRARARE